MSNTAIIALNGEIIDKKSDYKDLFKTNKSTHIAADGGALLLEKININPDLIIGDLDSLSKKDKMRFKNQNIKMIKYPAEKNETDGELAVDYCLNNNFDKIIFTFAMGGRFDQQLANIYLLEYAYSNNLEAKIIEPGMEIGLVNNKKSFINKKTWGLSLIPLDKRVKDVTIEGCKYLLDSFTLVRKHSRGISNIICKEKAIVNHGEGRLLYILNRNMCPSC